jgi:hypothetical protein
MTRYFLPFFFLPQLLSAAPKLSFDLTTSKATAQLGQDKVETEFKFKNTGDAILKLVDLEIGCKCLSAVSDKMQYQPGESGTIKATMSDLGTVEGDVSKSVKVISNDKDFPQIDLNFTATFPRLLEITERTTKWTVGEPAAAKTVKIKVLHDKPIQIKSAVSSRDTIAPSIKTITPGKEYEIVLTPLSTDNPLMAIISLETDFSIPKYARASLFATISRGPATK